MQVRDDTRLEPKVFVRHQRQVSQLIKRSLSANQNVPFCSKRPRDLREVQQPRPGAMATAQSTAQQPTVVRTAKLASTVSSASTVFIDRFSDILEIAAPGNKDKYITAAETYQIDVHASAMVAPSGTMLTVGACCGRPIRCHEKVKAIMDIIRDQAGGVRG